MSFLTFIEIVEAMVKVCIFYFKKPKISLWSTSKLFLKKSAKIDIQEKCQNQQTQQEHAIREVEIGRS
jgi:hypothetical protein